jgi:hypothetical protein
MGGASSGGGGTAGSAPTGGSASDLDGSVGGPDGSTDDPDGSILDGSAGVPDATGSTDAQLEAGDPCPGPADAAVDIECDGDRDCCASGRVCGEIRTDVAYCSQPFATGADFAEDCTGSLSGNGACASGVCLSTTGQCTAICEADSDCRAHSPTSLCHSFVTPAVGFCVPGCTGDRTCGANRICVLRDDTQRDRIDRYCRVDPATGADPGAACTGGAQCRHGICAFVGAEQFCASPCVGNADCPAAVPVCRNFPFLTPVSGKTVMVGLCAKS